MSAGRKGVVLSSDVRSLNGIIETGDSGAPILRMNSPETGSPSATISDLLRIAWPCCVGISHTSWKRDEEEEEAIGASI